MICCNHCGRCFCSDGSGSCPHCGCPCHGCGQNICLIGPQGSAGPRGKTGPIGPKGEQGYTPYIGDNENWYIDGVDTGKPSRGEQGIQGEKGESAENYTTVYLSAIQTGGLQLTVPVNGVAVPLSTTLRNGFTANGTLDTFTAEQGGVYLLMYNIKMSQNTSVKARVMRNGTLLSGTVRSTSVPTANYSLSLLVTLAAGDQLQLQLYDLNNVVVGLQGGTGASLVLIRLSE